MPSNLPSPQISKAETKLKPELSDTKVLISASGGRALRGVLFTKNFEDLLTERSYMLKAPENVSFEKAAQVIYINKQFSLPHQEYNYKKTFEAFGHAVAVSEKVCLVDEAMVTSESSQSLVVNTCKGLSKEMYSSTVQHTTVQLATYSFDSSNLILCNDAVQALKKLKVVISSEPADSTTVQTACENFFNMYGSHANKGPLHFGGVYMQTCSSSGFKYREREKVKKLQHRIISVSVRLGGSGEASVGEVKKDYAGKYSDTVLANTRLDVSVHGGPTEISDQSAWKIGLITRNSTWILTDRGIRLIPVWDIIEMNHNGELCETKEVLKNAWEKMAGLAAKETLMVDHVNLDEVLCQVNKWNESKDPTQDKIEDRLDYLIKMKNKLSHVTENAQVWVEEFLHQPSLQNFLLSIVILEKKKRMPISENIRVRMKKVLEPKDLKVLNSNNFPGLEKISMFLYKSDAMYSLSLYFEDCKDFQKLEEFMQATINEVEITAINTTLNFGNSTSYYDQESGVTVADQLTKAISSLRSQLQQSLDDVFITTLVYPFTSSNSDNQVTLSPISVIDLKCLHELFKEQRMKFDRYKNKGEELKLQAHIFHLAVCVYYSKLEATKDESQLKHCIQCIQQSITLICQLQPEVAQIIAMYQTNTCQLREFQEEMATIMRTGQPKPQQIRYEDDDHSLQQALSTTVHQVTSKQVDQTTIFTINKEVYSLFKELNICDLYPKKLSLEDALRIRPDVMRMSLNKTHIKTSSQLVKLTLHKIMSYDHLSRSDLMHAHRDRSMKIHPLDILLSLIICSDDFLCQDLMARLAKCQLAIPFILPDPFTKQLILPLWGMRSIVKEWKCIEKGSVVEMGCPIISFPTPIVTFIRIGKRQRRGASKSKIMNEVISKSHHDHFFHRDCAGGHFKLLMGEGLIDTCWYLPAAKLDDAFPVAVTFLNLHGDARNFQKQIDFLSQISSISFVLLTEEEKKLDHSAAAILKSFSSAFGGTVLLSDTDNPPTKLVKKLSSLEVIDLTSMNAHETKSTIQTLIKEKLQLSSPDQFNYHQFKSLEQCAQIAKQLDVDKLHLDEESELFSTGKKHADELLDLACCGELKKLNSKDTMLPLQGKDMWQAWATMDKELHRQFLRGKYSVNEYTSKIESEKAKIREEQLKCVTSLTPVMESFLVSLLSLGGISNSTVRNFYLQCLKNGLNDLSRQSISDLQKKYTTTRQALSKAQAKVEPTDSVDKPMPTQVDIQLSIDNHKKELNKLHVELIDASFGLEHLLRELGQLYETAHESSNPAITQQLSRLPQAAAELLIDGYPLELMDGDAAHVPVRWIKAVLSEVGKILDDPRVYVMSVLGLQSTGKSTMLNTAFGLQFNVSAGRCTRGAFMQLLTVSEEMKQLTNCAHVLVVDTEGLRAPELDSQQTQKHDNELATFVIGLANVTLINIYGEVPGDMDDILQTSVHAFLRMNVVRYNPSCQFVHQNAGASVNSEMGRASFTQKLNKMTSDAAKSENCVGQYTTFDDVIKFDDQRDVHHFPGLWKGDPPMAPVNQGYSECAQSLKFHIIGIVEESAKIDLLSSFESKIGDLWEALLTENFVFSFKNALEIAAYNSLETHYNSCDWIFQKEMLNWEKRADNDISVAALDDIPDLVARKKKEADVFVKGKHDELQSEMQKFFDESKQSDTLSQWKAKFELKLESLAEELKFHAQEHCERVGTGRLANCKFEEEKKQYETLMTQMVEDIIQKTKQRQQKLNENLEEGKLDEEQIQNLLKEGLFEIKRMEMYRKQKTISQSQLDRIKSICKAHPSPSKKLTEEQLRCILEETPKILSIDEIKNILKMGKLKPEQLRDKFDSKWKELMARLPPVYDAIVKVEDAVEERLIKFVGNEEGQLVKRLQEKEKKSLRMWGSDVPFEVEEGKHYVKIATENAWLNVVDTVFNLGKRILRITDPRKREAQAITSDLFELAKKHLDDKVREKTDFNKVFTSELLRILEETIIRRAKDFKDHFAFTPVYRIDVFLRICGYAVERFEEMAEDFKERNNPRVYLERKLKEPLFTKFKNQYYQTAKEEAIASTLCAHLEEPVKIQVQNSLGTLVVEKMKESGHSFDTKAALKARILIDLGDQIVRKKKSSKDDFDDYFEYLCDKETSLKQWIKKYTVDFCDGKISSEKKAQSRLQTLVRHVVSQLITFIKDRVDAIKVDDAGANEWLKKFCEDEDLISELGVKLDTSALEVEGMQELNLNRFTEQVRSGLNELEMKLKSQFSEVKCDKYMSTWRDNPVDLLMKLCAGCTAQCPFCKEQCDLGEHEPDGNSGIKHRVSQHRPQCLGGYRYIHSGIMALDLCPADVAGSGTFLNWRTNQEPHPYKDYQEIYPKWIITPDLVAKDSNYWKWFVGKYPEEIAKHFDAKVPTIPDGWKQMKWDNVKKELKELYKL